MNAVNRRDGNEGSELKKQLQLRDFGEKGSKERWIRKKVGTDGTGELRKGKKCRETGKLGTDMMVKMRQFHGGPPRGSTAGREVEIGRRDLRETRMTKWKQGSVGDITVRVLVDATVMLQQHRISESGTHPDARVAQEAPRLLHPPAPQALSTGSPNEEGVQSLQNMPLMIYSMIQHPNQDARPLQIREPKQEKQNWAGKLNKLRSNRETRAETAGGSRHL